MAQQSVRRGRENQGVPQCFKHALGDMDQARELPYRPAAAQRRIRGRTDGSIRLRATTILKFSLAKGDIDQTAVAVLSTVIHLWTPPSCRPTASSRIQGNTAHEFLGVRFQKNRALSEDWQC